MTRWLIASAALFAAAAGAVTLNLAWDPVVDGRLTGYELAWGDEPATYVNSQEVPVGTTTGTVTVPDDRRVHFAVRALGDDPDAGAITSNWSNEVDYYAATTPLDQSDVVARWEGIAVADPAFGALGTIDSRGASSTNTLTSTIANVAAGDLVLAFSQRDRQDNLTGITMDGNAMTLLKSNDSGDPTNFYFDVWGYIASSAAASADVIASYSDSQQWGTLFSARWSNVGSLTPLASSCNTTGCSGKAANSTTRTAQQITTSQRALIVAVGTDWNNYRTHTGANGFTVRADGSGTPVTSIQFIYDQVANAGSFGGASNFGTTNANDQYLSVLLAFEPAATVASLIPRSNATRFASILAR